MTPEQALALRAEFPPEEVGQLPKAGRMLDYVGHAAARLRLLDVDLEWNWEPMGTDDRGLPIFDADGAGDPIGLWIRLTVGGVTRLGYGSCPSKQFDAEKVLIGDAIRNAAMSFGVATYLWVKGHSGDEEPGDGPREREAPARPDPKLAGWKSRDEAVVKHAELKSAIALLDDAAREGLDVWRSDNGLTGWPLPRDAWQALDAHVVAALATALGASETLDGPDTPPAPPEAQGSAQGEPELPPAGSRHVNTPDIGTVGANGNESDPKISKLRVEMEVSTMSAPAIIAELEAVGLSPSGPPPKLKQRLVEHRLSVLAND